MNYYNKRTGKPYDIPHAVKAYNRIFRTPLTISNAIGGKQCKPIIKRALLDRKGRVWILTQDGKQWSCENGNRLTQIMTDYGLLWHIEQLKQGMMETLDNPCGVTCEYYEEIGFTNHGAQFIKECTWL